MARPSTRSTIASVADKTDQRIECGIIMPISATISHPEEHWRDVQILLHRAVAIAGFEPKNVWESALSDRVSERIVGNIFQCPIVVADISDLNPNVMLELGLRLASRKPTVVVLNDGGDIPFDIRDFHAIFYPNDLNILGMEKFFTTVSKVLREKYAASKLPDYTPFLGSLIVDVASPETREVGVNQIILDRIDQLSAQMRRIDPSGNSLRNIPRNQRPTVFNGKFEFHIPSANFSNFQDAALKMYEVDDVSDNMTDDDRIFGEIEYSEADNESVLWDKISDLIKQHGGMLDVPF